jgi:hypothetical protein
MDHEPAIYLVGEKREFPLPDDVGQRCVLDERLRTGMARKNPITASRIKWLTPHVMASPMSPASPRIADDTAGIEAITSVSAAPPEGPSGNVPTSKYGSLVVALQERCPFFK